MRPPRLRIDDRTALADQLLAQGSLAFAVAIALVGLIAPSMQQALVGALVIGAIAAFRLRRHPLRSVALRRVWIEGDRVLVARAFGAPRPVRVVRVEHERHSPWPVTLVLEGGETATFVARRDDGQAAFFDLDLDDAARYSRPHDARESIGAIERLTRR